MCYEDPRMVENLPNFYRSIVNVRDINNKPMFDYNELDTIVIQAQELQFPIVSAKAWAVCDSKKLDIFHGKNQDF